VTLIDLVDHPSVCYGNPSTARILGRGVEEGVLPHGQYAFAVADGDAVYLGRDPLGCNKLFFGRDAAGRVLVGNRILQLWRRGVPLPAIASCPPGHVLAIASRRVRKLAGAEVSRVPADPDFRLGHFQATTRAALDRTFAWLADAFRECRFAVSLSGGLDSSVIASFAAARLPGVVAATFTYLDEDDRRRHARGCPIDRLATASGDCRSAARVASALGMPLVLVTRPRQAVAGAIRQSVELCQDWRDFNVHCATVNVFIAQDLRAAFPGERVVVLTGDLMNEFVGDYREERVDTTVYYRLPRVPADRRRRAFVRGLDAGDREIGVFWRHGLTTCQPFAALAEHYLRIPPALLDEPDLKWTLNEPLLAPRVIPHVSRSKRRAQVGGPDRGTLGVYHELGVGEPQLRRLWREQFPGEPPERCDELIHVGRYRAPRWSEVA
jgi:asparagine synthetase B (glutamine-hydrolysing)